MPKSYGNRYWLTPATKKILSGDPAVSSELHRALARITALHRGHPFLLQKFHRETLPTGDELIVRSQWGREYVYLRRAGEEGEEIECKVCMEAGRLTKIVLNESDPDMAAVSQLEYGEFAENWVNSHPNAPWLGCVFYGTGLLNPTDYSVDYDDGIGGYGDAPFGVSVFGE